MKNPVAIADPFLSMMPGLDTTHQMGAEDVEHFHFLTFSVCEYYENHNRFDTLHPLEQ
jgi:hypothetical protein